MTDTPPKWTIKSMLGRVPETTQGAQIHHIHRPTLDAIVEHIRAASKEIEGIQAEGEALMSRLEEAQDRHANALAALKERLDECGITPPLIDLINQPPAGVA